MKRILYVDDDHILSQGVRDILALDGYEVRLASNGQAALDVLDAGYMPDLIISNIMMPRMDGYEFFQRIKQQEHVRAIPFILSSALSLSETRTHELGADDFIQTPFDAEDLLAVVKKHVGE